MTIHATDWLGNSAAVNALPIVHVAAPPPRKHKTKPKRTVASARTAVATLPPLVVGAGLDQPGQAGLAAQAGLGAVRMTLVWPGRSAPDPGVLTALAKLPPATNLVLGLFLRASRRTMPRGPRSPRTRHGARSAGADAA